ncbi:MAG: hypothetical protein AB7S41_02835 [Parvibaculaceae bacterium]
MCGLCGAFGVSDHWAASPGEASAAERHGRASVANQVLGLYGLKLKPWGNRFTLQGPTGRSAVVDHFGTLWPEAEKLAGRPCDPLDPAVLEALEASRR